MDTEYLLTTQLAKRIYHEVAEKLPIIDYHNHLSVADIAADKKFADIAELWILSDPYKHRAMRICGVKEELITGKSTTDKEKFFAWCEIFPRLIGNPLYVWSLSELSRIFGIQLVPSADTAKEIWKTANDKLSLPSFSAKGLLNSFGVEYASPCAALCDDLSPYGTYGGTRLAPSLRGDSLVCPSHDTVEKLSNITNTEIRSFDDYKNAVKIRLNAFKIAGCRFSDHALDNGFRYFPDDGNNDKRFKKLLSGCADAADKAQIISAVLRFLVNEYASLGWTMQLHIGAERFTSSRLRTLAGAAGGFASVGNTVDVKSLTSFLDDAEKQTSGLPKTVLMTLNPADDAVMSALSGSYSKDGVPALVSQGPAWWWCDHLTGMTEVFESVSAYGVMSCFIGMTTDSRSLLSFLRHDYFRRVFCKWLGEKSARNELPSDFQSLAPMVRAVCYGNARSVI